MRSRSATTPTADIGAQARAERSLIQAYGLFWRADDVEWNARQATTDRFARSAVLGRRGDISRKACQVVDFRGQRGVYVLYGNYGPTYVGVTTTGDLGRRLNQHRKDEHGGRWDRFSWFGFRHVVPTKAILGCYELGPQVTQRTVTATEMIKQMEALLIHAMSPVDNLHWDAGSLVGQEWKQVARLDRTTWPQRFSVIG